MSKVTRIRVVVKPDRLVLTSYGQTARGTKFSKQQITLKTDGQDNKPSVEALVNAVDKLRK